MKKILLIDGNSIMNRAFYGIMSPMTTKDGKPTNALYGFLNILFRDLDELKPDYLLIAFDSKTAANVRKQKYEGYKKSRHKMPEELAEQMPEIKEILDAMNIKHMELPNYEGDDILGTAAKRFVGEDTEAYILSGDRDLFQLIQDNIKIRIPHTKSGKTETEIFDVQKIKEEKGIEPKDLIEVKALMGDPSDEIPGAPGIGEKTALSLIQEYGTVDNLYKCLENVETESSFKPKVRSSLLENKELVYLSRELGKIDLNANIDCSLEDIVVKEWDNEKVIELFQRYSFKRFMERFNLSSETINSKTKLELKDLFKLNQELSIEQVIDEVKKLGKLVYYLGFKNTEDQNQIIKSEVADISIYNYEKNEVYHIKKIGHEDQFKKMIKELFEDENIEKYGYELNYNYIILKQMGITTKNNKYDIVVASYILNPIVGKYPIDSLCEEYLKFGVNDYLLANNMEDTNNTQITLFDTTSKDDLNIEIYKQAFYSYSIWNIKNKTEEQLNQTNSLDLFNKIDMPTVEVLANMQWNGMHADEQELKKFGDVLKEQLEQKTNNIYKMAGEEFNINSTQQLGLILFEKLKLPASKKNKKGYSTDVDTLEGLKNEHPIINEILEFRTLSKLKSTYVEGLIPTINPKTKRIHSFFHQTITATGRISSTEPNLQNIPTREEFGKNIRKAFKAEKGYIYIDADYSQIELRILSHIAKDENMIKAFLNDEDIHREVASRVFDIPFNEVTKEQRSRAKAVNFGIVYGITGFGLAKQIGISRKEAEVYKESYLSKFNGVKEFMNEIIKKAEKDGYVETLFGRRRYIPELKSTNYMTREFGKRVAMNTPIQGTAADIMKIAMNNVYKELQQKNLDAKIVLQVHDELLIEAKEEQKEEVKEILKHCMENASKLDIPLKVEIQEAYSWYDAK